MANPFQSPAVLSICPGNLGIERGLEQAIGPLRIMAYVEIESYVIANLLTAMEAGMVDPAPIWTDAKTFDASPFYRKIHGIVGGYPCPGESLSGLRQGHLYKGFIWPAIRKAIAATRPLFCFFENVDDHLTGTYPIVQRSLRNLGYAVEAGIYTAEEVGAPHERKRIFILALAEPYRLAARGKYADLLKPGKADERETWFKNWQWGGNGIAVSSEELGDTKGGKNKRGKSGNLDEAKRSGRRKYNADCNASKSMGSKGNPGLCDGQKEPTGFIQPEKNNNSLRPKLEHPEVQRQQGLSIEKGDFEEKNEESNPGSRIDRTNTTFEFTKYPAGQGTFQYEWEAPRVIEPGLGCTINGYNFREDILRSIGNMVVADCAEIAFIDLLKKLLT